jgi:hypothetical protein
VCSSGGEDNFWPLFDWGVCALLAWLLLPEKKIPRFGMSFSIASGFSAISMAVLCVILGASSELEAFHDVAILKRKY